MLKIANYELVFFISLETLTIAFRGNTNILPKMCRAVIGEKKKKKDHPFFSVWGWQIVCCIFFIQFKLIILSAL